jgi:hypothetical protein
MPGLNYIPRMVQPILDGTKVHTIRFSIRSFRKGMMLYMQTGSRFRPKRFMTAPAMRVRDIDITQDAVVIWKEDHRGFIAPARDKFARADGFKDWKDFQDFFRSRYNLGNESYELKGQLIQWAQAEWEK